MISFYFLILELLFIQYSEYVRVSNRMYSLCHMLQYILRPDCIPYGGTCAILTHMSTSYEFRSHITVHQLGLLS